MIIDLPKQRERLQRWQILWQIGLEQLLGFASVLHR